jgi:hypothetical protein
MTNWTEELTDEQKKQVWDFIVFTVKEIREQIALDIEYTYEVWATHGKTKSRRTKKAFEVCADIARGLNELVDKNGRSESNTTEG